MVTAPGAGELGELISVARVLFTDTLGNVAI
jgi:hypothetical protein